MLVGVSGGVDSMVLLHCLDALGFAVTAAHVNYGMRADESEEDQRLVEDWCRQRQIPLAIHRVSDTFLDEAKEASFQAAAREERYLFFQKEALERGINNVAVAHHLDDQVETVLMRLMRGSGVEGLAGMAPSRKLSEGHVIKLIRPLLAVSRAQILDFAKAADILWREDGSNDSRQYTRNTLRLDVLPVLRNAFGNGAIENIAQSATLLRGYLESTFQPALEERFDSVASGEGVLDLPALKEQPLVWQTRLILEAIYRWSPDSSATLYHAEAICQLIDAQVGRRVVLKSTEIWREREVLRFVERKANATSEEVTYLLMPGEQTSFEGGEVNLTEIKTLNAEDLICNENEMFADADLLHFPLQLRRWKAGDRFVPFGMSGQKKISDFLTDQKIPSHSRDDVWVLLSGEEVIWVVGMRASDKIKVTPKTSKVLRCMLTER